MRSGESKVMRRLPESGSMPIMEMSMPSSAAMQPLSSAPSDSVATVASTIQEKMPPMKEAMVVISNALSDSPRAVNFGPSSMVAAAAAVPGVPTRMAVMLPA